MAMKVFSPGVLGSADVNEYLVNTKFAIKPADTSRVSVAAMSSDPDLSLPIDTNKSYLLEVFLCYGGTASAGDFKFGFNAPAGAILYGYAVAITYPSGNNTPYIQGYDASLPLSQPVPSGIPGFVGDITARVSGILVTAGTAGNLVVKWAQNTSNGAATILRAGSSMTLRRVA